AEDINRNVANIGQVANQVAGGAGGAAPAPGARAPPAAPRWPPARRSSATRGWSPKA
ncbi:hypothetical protein I5F67_24875, partial [Pseudomonas aeruginosa]|nr:hypothetical protein [Pseudomonas aeruginosa]